MNSARRLFIHYAETYPKASTSALLGGTILTCVVMVKAIEARDAYKESTRIGTGDATLQQYDDEGKPVAGQQLSVRDAQIMAMIQNAKESTWRENLTNAADAQERFMLPGRQEGGEGEEKEDPEYVRKIEDRSLEIMKEQQEKVDGEKNRKITTRFWN